MTYENFTGQEIQSIVDKSSLRYSWPMKISVKELSNILLTKEVLDIKYSWHMKISRVKKFNQLLTKEVLDLHDLWKYHMSRIIKYIVDKKKS